MNGTIRRRGKSNWELRFDLPRGADGKRRRKSVYINGRKSDAELELRKLLDSLDQGIPLLGDRSSIGEYLSDWHRDYAVTNTRPRTAERYLGDIRNHLVPHLGHFRLTRLTPIAIQTMEADMLSKGLSPSSVGHCHRVLSQALKHAVEKGLLRRNPCDAVRPPRQIQRELKIPDAVTVLRLLELAKTTPYHVAFHFLAFTGARRGEACGLMWSDLDLDRGKAAIQRSAGRITGQGVAMLPPKTARSRRTIALDPDTVDILRSHRGTQLVKQIEFEDLYTDSGYVFTDPVGRPLDPFVLTDSWRKLVKTAGVGRIRLHDLRHFHASTLLQVNTHPKVVSERLGHSTVSITLDVYSHTVPSLQEEAAVNFAEAMRSSVKRRV